MVPLKASLFISYSSSDHAFAEKLARAITLRGKDVWFDRWEIKVGDSLLDKIEGGIGTSSYVGVVLSRASVASKWVREELKAALARERGGDRVVVVPILAEDCEIPLFLQDKRYADFRANFDEALAELLRRLEPPDVASHGRIDAGLHHNDYAIDWDFKPGKHRMTLEMFSYGPSSPYSVSCSIAIAPNAACETRLDTYDREGFGWFSGIMMLGALVEVSEKSDPRILIESNTQVHRGYDYLDPKTGRGMDIHFRARRLGPEVEGRDVLFEWGSVVHDATQHHIETIQKVVPASERLSFQRWSLTEISGRRPDLFRRR